ARSGRRRSPALPGGRSTNAETLAFLLHRAAPETNEQRFRGQGGGSRGNQGFPRALQTSSFEVTGSTETTWRLNFSSDSSSPAATPISCERCRIGIA